jgi:hypothetical protein
MRATMPATPNPSVTAGSTSWATEPWPLVGSQPRRTAKTSVSTMPSQKGGTATPTMAKDMTR